MRPFTLVERGVGTPSVSLLQLLEGECPPVRGKTDVDLDAYTREILSSGFPGLRHLEGRALRAQLDSYIHRIVDTDFEQLGRKVRNPDALRRWMRAYAAATATTASWETVRSAATAGQGNKPAKSTTLPYREALEQLWVLDQVPAWIPSRNYFSRLSRSSKHHLCDPALAARLLGVGRDALLEGRGPDIDILRDGVLLGHLFESLVTLCVRVFAQRAEAEVRHLRLRGGRREVDLIVKGEDERVLAIEVKLSSTVDDEDLKHLIWLRDKLGDDLLDAVIITTGPEAYRRRNTGIAVVPAALLGS